MDTCVGVLVHVCVHVGVPAVYTCGCLYTRALTLVVRGRAWVTGCIPANVCVGVCAQVGMTVCVPRSWM